MSGNGRAERRRRQREIVRGPVETQIVMLATRQPVEDLKAGKAPKLNIPAGPGWDMVSHAALLLDDEIWHLNIWRRLVQSSGLVTPG